MFKIVMPALSPTMKFGTIAKWLKKEGEIIFPGDVVAEIETDKTTMEIESTEEGILSKILFEEGYENIPINTTIAIILEENEVVNDNTLNDTKNDLVIKSIKNIDHIEESNNKLNILEEKNILQKKILISPLANKIAKENKIDIEKVQGTGPYNRIIKNDIMNILSKNNHSINLRNDDTETDLYPLHSDYQIVKANSLRKSIADRLVKSKSQIPHFYLNIECNVSKLIKIKEEIYNNLNIKISINDFIILASAHVLKKLPKFNVSWNDNAIKHYNSVNISIAVSIDNGLIAPIIYNVDKKNLIQLSQEIKNLVNKARENKLSLDEFDAEKASFTISNLGMYGIKNFHAIINYPQSSILAVGTIIKRPIVEQDTIKITDIMELSLSCDHRAIDGVLAANFLQLLKQSIENPLSIIIGI